MGLLTLQALLRDSDALTLSILALPTEQSRQVLKPYLTHPALHIVWGDLTKPADVRQAVQGAEVILHLGALVSPEADYAPEKAMAVNFGGVVNLIEAVRALGQEQTTRFVNIGTVAQTGDRMPPIHWGRVGDPLKPSVFDYYAVSKIAAERYVIESGLPYWVSLRQTGILGPKMAGIQDAIMFHNGLDNVLEYVSDRDAARLMLHLCQRERRGELGSTFWGHIFNIGGGEACRISTYALYGRLFGQLGFSGLQDVMDAKWFATRNFHGQYYLDSDRLNDLLDFRQDSLPYFDACYQAALGWQGKLVKAMNGLGGHKATGHILKARFRHLARTQNGTLRFVEQGMEGHIAAFWGSRAAWEAIRPLHEYRPYSAWNDVVAMNHGYDETKTEQSLTLVDVQGAARFRGGQCTSSAMAVGEWRTPLDFQCAFGHSFSATARLVLEGGHWCPHCERDSWNYAERANMDPFFAQVWTPLHPPGEPAWRYPKLVSDLDVLRHLRA